MTEIITLQSALAGLGTGDPNERVIGTKTSGPLGIEAIFEYNGIYLNFREWIDTYVVTDLDGIDDADVRDSREDNPGRHGETPGEAVYGGRTLVLGGHIQTKTIWKMRDMQQALREAFADISVERPLILHGPIATNDLMIYCKKLQKLQMPEKQDTSNDFKRNFQIYLRASKPWFVTQSRPYEFWAPVGGATTVDAIILTPTNLGNFKAEPYLELTGPMAAPTFVNETTGGLLAFTTNIPAGEIWVVDFTANPYTIYRKSDKANRYTFISTLSTDLLLEKGTENQIRLTATGLTEASKVDFWHRHTVM